MKKHPLLTASSYLLEACGAISLIIMVYFTVFKVVLAEEEDSGVKIWYVAIFMICSIITCLLEMITGNNALKGESLINCRALGFSVLLFSILTIITGFLAGQLWIPYGISIILGVLFNYGVEKTIKM